MDEVVVAQKWRMTTLRNQVNLSNHQKKGTLAIATKEMEVEGMMMNGMFNFTRTINIIDHYAYRCWKTNINKDGKYNSIEVNETMKTTR